MPPLTFPIHTARLKLRPFTEDNFGALYAMQSRPDVTRFLYWDPRTEDEVRRSLTERRQNVHIEAEGDRLSLAIERREGGAFVGDVTLHSVSAQHRTVRGKTWRADAVAGMLRRVKTLEKTF